MYHTGNHDPFWSRYDSKSETFGEKLQQEVAFLLSCLRGQRSLTRALTLYDGAVIKCLSSSPLKKQKHMNMSSSFEDVLSIISWKS
jgi:hypothetical protein